MSIASDKKQYQTENLSVPQTEVEWREFFIDFVKFITERGQLPWVLNCIESLRRGITDKAYLDSMVQLLRSTGMEYEANLYATFLRCAELKKKGKKKTTKTDDEPPDNNPCRPG